MKNLILAIALPMLASASAASGQAPQPNAMMLAQALDRCMTTYAVRMTRTDATDDAIFLAAQEGCAELEQTMTAALRSEQPQQADAMIAALSAQARPNFMSLLNRIRTDRAARMQQQ